MRKGDLFPVSDRVPGVGMGNQHKVRARFTGELRPPKKGEWFISGAIPSAYQALDDLDWTYHIAELVFIEVRTSYHVTGIVQEEEE